MGTRPWHGAAHFEDLVSESIASLTPDWGHTLARVAIEIAELPDLEFLHPEPQEVPEIPLARLDPNRLTLFRHPITIRCNDGADLQALILDVIIEQVAELAGVEPEDVDERYGNSG